MGRKIIILIILLFPTVFYSQVKISGQIRDKKNNPIDYIEVLLQNKDSVYIKSELTNADGKFTVEADKGEYTVIVRQMGTIYHSQKIDLKEDIDLGVIQINKKQLSEVVISGKKPIYKQEYDKLIFNVENSPLNIGYDGIEVLKRSPKIQINSNGDILLRNQSVLVLINGRKMNMSGQELSNYLRSINSENIKSIEIQDVGSAETDASNTGGVVNISLKKIQKGFLSTVKIYFIHRNFENNVCFSGITNQFSSKKWNIFNKINYINDENSAKFNSTTNFNSTFGKNENSGKSNTHNNNFNTTNGIIFYPNDKNEMGMEIYYSNNKSDRNGIENLMIYNPDLNAIADNFKFNFSRTNFWNTVINYTYKLDSLGSKIKLIADIGNNKMNNNNEVDTRYTFGDLLNNKNRFLSDANSNFYNIQANWNKKTITNSEFVFGAKLSSVSRKNELITYLYKNNNWQLITDARENFDNTENIIASNISYAKKIKNKHQFKIGVRTEYTDLRGDDYINNTKVKQNYFDWFPNFFYAYEIKENQNLSFSYSKRIQRPSFRDLNPFVIKQNDYLYQIGNPNLQAQYTNKVDISYQHKNQTFSLYGNFTNDYITEVYTTEENISYYQPQNFGKTRDIGFDYSYYGDITKWLYSNISMGVWNYNFEKQNLEYNNISFYFSIYSQVKFTKSFLLDIYNSFYSKNQYGTTQGAEQYRLDFVLKKNIWKGSGQIRIAFEDVFNTVRDKNISYYENFNFIFYQKRKSQSLVLMFVYTFKNNGNISDKNIQQSNDNKERL